MALPDETVQRVRGYLVGQAAKLSPAEIVEKVQSDGETLREAALAVPRGRFFERPGGAGSPEWSAAEVLTHVLQAGEICATAIEQMIDTGATGVYLDATNEARPVAAVEIQSAADFWDAFEERRGRLFDRVLQSRGDEHPEATLQHQWFGAFTWRETLLFLRVHDQNHAGQLQAIAASLKE